MIKKALGTTCTEVKKAKVAKIICATQQKQIHSSILVPERIYSPSKSDEESRERILALYRHIFRWLPYVKDRYHVPVDMHLMKKRIRMDFERYKNTPLSRSFADAMVFRAYNELEEVKRQHQTRSHVLKYFSQAEPLMRQIQMRQSGEAAAKALLNASLMHSVATTLRQKPDLINVSHPNEQVTPSVAAESIPVVRETRVEIEDDGLDLAEFVAQQKVKQLSQKQQAKQ
jgi:hypothetical protein